MDRADAAPGGTSVIQIKVLDELLDYPRGKSAMVWYGVIFECTPVALRGVLEEVAGDFGGRRLVWRHQVSEEPEALLDGLLARFKARFGAAPGCLG
ncbi:MAG: hypothetical protein QF464_06815 [Myxococcota bacterium]|nr:hypothetical protein [Myxococcota bacterium]